MKRGAPSADLDELLAAIRACRRCRDDHLYGAPLPHEPRPVLQLSGRSRILLAGQAPGARVHASGQPFTDPSGDRLRDWLGVSEQTFYDPDRLAIVPMGFCFPGTNPRGADHPPRRECRRTWHDALFASRPPFDLTLVIGTYARDYHLPAHKGEPLTKTIARQLESLEATKTAPVLVLPHPSWRNTAWLKRNPWFEAQLLPIIKDRIRKALDRA
ncbi:MAG: uracil-DNA glycosylase family protein [Devosiaceae bacterium]|nr:uracil-DNA glycosylase family protein [Devosiaceae bacterium MH13]